MPKRRPLPEGLLPLDARHFYIRDVNWRPVGVAVVLQRYDRDGYDLGISRCNFDAGDEWDRVEGINTALKRARNQEFLIPPTYVSRPDLLGRGYGQVAKQEANLYRVALLQSLKIAWGLSDRTMHLRHFMQCLIGAARRLHLFCGEPAGKA